MSKKFNPTHHYVLTANELSSGDVVFWTGNAWTHSILDACFAFGEEAVQTLEHVSVKQEALNTVVGAYLVPMQSSGFATAKTMKPVELREQRRLNGPSIDFAPKNIVERIAA